MKTAVADLKINYGPYKALCPDGKIPENAVTKVDEIGNITILYIPTLKGAEAHQAPERYVLAEGGRGSGKALALDTLILTPTGFRTMEALKVGDWVFEERGFPQRVIWKSEAHIDPTGTFKVTFSDGTVVVAGGQHEWLTQAKKERRDGRVGTIRTTQQIQDTLTYKKSASHTVTLAPPQHQPPQNLPVPPYTLGAWLGDGSKGTDHITGADEGIFEAIRAEGFVVRKLNAQYVWKIEGLLSALRQLDAIDQTQITCASCHRETTRCSRGLCVRCYDKFQKQDQRRPRGAIAAFDLITRTGTKRYAGGVLKQKRIPEQYFLGSADQRLALLQGLMDTDGTVSVNGHVTFTNTNRALADGVLRLARSLGIKVTLTEGKARLYGRIIGPCYHVMWTSDVPVFRLTRKLARLNSKNAKNRSVLFITGIERVADQPLQCIQVEGSSHLYLCSESLIPTHNSVWLRWDAHLRNLMIPGHRALLLRRTFPQLQGSHFAQTAVEGKALGCVRDFNVSKYFLEYNNESLLKFGHVESDAAIMDYLSQEWDWIGFDELTTFTYDQFIRISQSSRSAKTKKKMAFVRGATNPVGEGASWVKRYFIDHSVTPEENPRYKKASWRSIKMNLIDNPHMNQEEYEESLQMLPSETLRRAYIGGEWLVEGQFFSQFMERLSPEQAAIVGGTPGQDWHVVQEMPRIAGVPIHLIDWIQIVRFVDWGYSEAEPGYCGWVAMLPDGTALVFKEWVFTGQIPELAAKKIKEMSAGMKIRMTLGDPMMWQERTGESIAETMARHGVAMIEANNDRENGWMRVHSWLSSVYNDGTGPRPRLQLLAPQEAGTGLGCPYAIRSLPSLQTNPKKPTDILEGTGVEDHFADGIRYWSSNRPSPTLEPVKTLSHLPRELQQMIAKANGEYPEGDGLIG